MTSKVIVPVSDFAALITRLEKVEEELTARKEREAKRYNHGPCLRCGYGPWESFRVAAPKCCPRCHSAYWDQEPRHKRARMPEDPPNPLWTSGKPGPRDRARAAKAAPTPVVEAVVPVPAATKPPVVLPPELRPPGEELIPPPPRLPDVVAARTVDNPMNARPVTLVNGTLSEQLAARSVPLPTEHVAPLPDTIVERILATGDAATIDEIRAAKEGGDAASVQEDPASGDGTDGSSAEVDGGQRDDGRIPERDGVRPTAPALQAKKDAFFADAIEAGLVSPVPERTPAPDPSPFVAPSLGDTVPDKVKEDDPFWK
jgi:hypothetical protein